MFKVPDWTLGDYIAWLRGRIDDPVRLAEAMSDTIVNSDVSLITFYGSILAERLPDNKRWTIYVLNGTDSVPHYTTKGDGYAGSYGGYGTNDRVRETLLKVLEFLVVFKETPEALREELENSKESFRRMLSR
jgi:hypothetical protein